MDFEPGRLTGITSDRVAGRWISLNCYSNRLVIAELRAEAKLVKARRHFGGYQVFFACPYCGQRASILYYPHLTCRKCLNLAYEVQNETDFNRCMRGASKYAERLTTDAERPKHMKRVKYRKLRKKHDAYIDETLKIILGDKHPNVPHSGFFDSIDS